LFTKVMVVYLSYCYHLPVMNRGLLDYLDNPNNEDL